MPIYKVRIDFSGTIEKEIEADNEKLAKKEAINDRINKYDIEDDLEVDFVEILSEEPTDEELEQEKLLGIKKAEIIDYKELEEKGQLKLKVE